MEHELRQNRENLQATIEVLEASNEELQSTNEEPPILLIADGSAVDRVKAVEKAGVNGVVGVLQGKLDGFAEQVRPAELVLGEQAAIGGVVVADADAGKTVAEGKSLCR